MNNEDIIKVENLKHPKDTYVIRWCLTRLCNYYCDFCIQGNKEKHIKDSIGESKELREKICDKIIEFIELKLNKKYKVINFYLIGGEITILDDFLDILKKINNCKFEGKIIIHITTNLSCDKKLINNIIKIYNKKYKYERRLSFGVSFYKKYTTEEVFMDKLKLFYKNNTNIFKKLKHKIFNIPTILVIVSYPLVEDIDYDRYLEFLDKYDKYVEKISYIAIRNYHKSISNKLKDSLPKESKKIKVTLKNGEERLFYKTDRISLAINKTRVFNPYGMLCDSGVNNISIDNLGNISRCSSCAEKSLMGNVLNDELKLYKEKMICPIKKCNCDYYSVIERKK